METIYNTPGTASRPSIRHDGATTPSAIREILVLHTAVPNTLHALHEAAALASGLSTPIRLVVPHVVHYPLPLDRPPDDLHDILHQLSAATEDAQLPTTVDVRLCRDAQDAVHQVLTPNSLIVIGAHHHWGSPRECRIAARLRREGHHVLLSEF